MTFNKFSSVFFLITCWNNSFDNFVPFHIVLEIEPWKAFLTDVGARESLRPRGISSGEFTRAEPFKKPIEMTSWLLSQFHLVTKQRCHLVSLFPSSQGSCMWLPCFFKGSESSSYLTGRGGPCRSLNSTDYPFTWWFQTDQENNKPLSATLTASGKCESIGVGL